MQIADKQLAANKWETRDRVAAFRNDRLPLLARRII